MRLRDYFRGLAVELESPLSPDELERRINAATVSRWRSFAMGAVGGARSGRVRLRYRPRFFEYNMTPVLVGRIEPARRGSVLRLRYRGPTGALIFFPLFYVTLAALLGLAFFGKFEGGVSGTQVIPLSTILIFLLFPLGLHYLGTRSAAAHLQALIDYLERAAEARLVRREGFDAS